MTACTHDHSRWGATDQIGAANLLTPEKRLAALRSVTQGRIFDVSHEIAMNAPYMMPNQTPYLMSLWTNWRDSMRRRRKLGATNEVGVNIERMEMTAHVGTHIDALGHFFREHNHFVGFLRSHPDQVGQLFRFQEGQVGVGEEPFGDQHFDHFQIGRAHV